MDGVRRRRRSSGRFEDATPTRRFTRHSMPAVSIDGQIKHVAIGLTDVAPTGEKSRRLSEMNFSLPGLTGNLMHADDERRQNGVEDGDDGLPEYQFPAWWFVILTLPGFLHSLVSNALWGIIWPNLLSEMSGDKYKALALAAGRSWWQIASGGGALAMHHFWNRQKRLHTPRISTLTSKDIFI